MKQSWAEGFFRFAAIGSAVLTIAVFIMMVWLGWPIIESGKLAAIFLGEWNPRQDLWGIYPMVMGSLRISLLAVMFSVPLSLGAACTVTVLAPRWLRRPLCGVIRFMAGIPTVIYGFVAVFLLVPFMRLYVTGGSGFSIFTASLVLSILIAPTMIIFFVNGLNNVPKQYCLAVDALGARPRQKLLYLLIPQSWPTIVAGVILGLGRAMGDTLISLMLAGNSVALPESMIDSGRTLTAHIALVIAADFDSLQFRTIFACGLALYLFTFLIVAILKLLSRRIGGEIA